MRWRSSGTILKLTLAAAYLLSAIIFNGLQLRLMGLADAYAAPMAQAMSDGMPCHDGMDGGGAGGGHSPGKPHCPICLVAVSPGLVVAPQLVNPPQAVPVAVAALPMAVAAAPAPVWSPQSARAPPLPTFA